MKSVTRIIALASVVSLWIPFSVSAQEMTNPSSVHRSVQCTNPDPGTEESSYRSPAGNTGDNKDVRKGY